MTTTPTPLQTDDRSEAPTGHEAPDYVQAHSRNLEAEADNQRHQSGDLPLRGELEPADTSNQGLSGVNSDASPRSRRAVRAGKPLTQPTKPGSPQRTELSERLIVENQGLAHSAANKWARRCSRPFEDFVGPAIEGLINGCRRYDPERINPSTGRPYAVSSCVCQFIEGSIKHFIRDHGYDVKMPSKWREFYPRVRRLLADGLSHAQIVEILPSFTEEEVTEMISGMIGTIPLEDELTLFSDHQPQVSDDPIAPALYELTEQAYSNIRPADRGLLARWAMDPFKRQYPSGPMLQFHGHLKAQLSGRSLQQFRQGVIGIDVASVVPQRRERRIRKPQAAAGDVVQTSLFIPGRQRRNSRSVKI